jgi:hypothetical protein
VQQIIWDINTITMYRDSPGVDKLREELLKKGRQVDQLDGTVLKLNSELDAAKKQIFELRKVSLRSPRSPRTRSRLDLVGTHPPSPLRRRRRSRRPRRPGALIWRA